MGLHKNHFLTFLVAVVSLSSLRTNGVHHELLAIGDYVPDEYGNDFAAYPSYFSPLEGVKFDALMTIDDRVSNENKGLGRVEESVKSINVLNFGAKGHGEIDDTKAFENAWLEACSSSEDVNLVVPPNKAFLLKPLRFSGPCNSHIKFQVAGAIVASDDESDYEKDRRHWLLFDNVQNLMVAGDGKFDGNGDVWWQNSCKINKAKPCQNAPTALTFYNCTNLVVKNLKIENAQQMHVSLEQCSDVEVSNLNVNSPEKSPNTDGIHVTATQNIHIHNSIISTGDDCISIVSGSKKVRATDITCGPGHGISIGSLGSGNSEEHVSDVVVNRAKLYGTTNGVRIKTWQGGSGTATKIKFQNIQMQNVQNPIIIDQNYCDRDHPCKQQSSAVQVKNVVYENIKGSITSNPGIKFECSKSHPCKGIVLQNVNLVGANGTKSDAVCNNVKLQKLGNVSPDCP